MAAPSGTTWGSIVGSYGRIGIYTKLTNTNTKTTVDVEIWFWSKYSISDGGNTLYFDNRSSSGSASTSRGSISISTSVDTGSGWSESNQRKLKSYSYEYTRGTSASTRYLYAKFANVDRVGGTMYASKTVSIPKLTSYTIKYNANGGSGAPSSQTKYYGKTLTISSTKPTRTGYSFLGWSTSSSAATAAYSDGGSYTANASDTLYAVWKANTYTVKYNANGGSGAPSDQTKTYEVTLKLSSTIPTKPNYNFLGWSTSATATTATYSAGGNYTENSAATLYAVWELAYVRPRINGLSVFRVKPVTDEEGNTEYEVNEEGTYAAVTFNWACDQAVSSIVIEWKTVNETDPPTVTLTPTELSGDVNVIIGEGDISTDSTYTVTVTVTDTNGYSEVYTSLPGTKLPIDVIPGNDSGISFGKPAELKGVADFAYKIKAGGGFENISIPENTDLNTLLIPNTYVSYDKVASTYLNCPASSGTFKLVVKSGGNEGQVTQTLTYTSQTDFKVYERHYHSIGNGVFGWGEWYVTYAQRGILLWSGEKYMTAGHTAELSQPISKMPHGIVLVFSRYTDGVANDYHWNCFFIPKMQTAMHGGQGHSFIMTNGNSFGIMAAKYLYIHDESIVGNVDNNKNGTAGSGITYDNAAFVLRYVIGV